MTGHDLLTWHTKDAGLHAWDGLCWKAADITVRVSFVGTRNGIHDGPYYAAVGWPGRGMGNNAGSLTEAQAWAEGVVAGVLAMRGTL